MFERALDNRSLRFTIGAVFGVPVTVLALLGAIYGSVFGLVWLENRDPLFLSFAATGALGVLGVCGAWLRLLTPHTAMSSSRRLAVRALLFAGVISSAYAAAQLLISAEMLLGALFVFLCLGGVMLVLGTPYAL